MSNAAAQAARFYEQVVKDDRVFTVDDGKGFLVFPVRDTEVVPFWSSRSRLLKIHEAHPKYAKWKISEESLPEFLEKTLPLLEKEGIRVGVNWSGERLTGYDLSVHDLRSNLQYWIDKKLKGL